MAPGDAIKIRRHAIRLVDKARAAGDTSIALRVGDIKKALDLHGQNATGDIRQVLDSELFTIEARIVFSSKHGQGMNTEYRFSIE